MPHGEDFCQHRQPFFRTVLLVTGKKDNMLARARTLFALVCDPIFGLQREGSDKKERE